MFDVDVLHDESTAETAKKAMADGANDFFDTFIFIVFDETKINFNDDN